MALTAEAGGKGGGGIRCDKKEGDPWWRGDDGDGSDDKAPAKLRFLLGGRP